MSQCKTYLFLLMMLIQLLRSLCENCGQELIGLHGKFSTPNYPAIYPNNLNCQWNITVPEGYYIMLNFTQFELEWIEQCTYDYVIVKSNNGTFGKFCGQRNEVEAPKAEAPPRYPLAIHDRKIEVKLHTDFSNEVEVHGFEAHFAALDINECATNNGGCSHFCHNFIGGYCCSCRIGYRLDRDKKTCLVRCQKMLLLKPSGFIQSPEYPMNYPPQSQCDWHITAEKGYYVNIQFLDFHIEDHYDSLCPYDKLLMEDEQSKMGPFCGKQIPLPYRSASNWLIVEFFSDTSQGAKGFRAKYWLEPRKCQELKAPKFGYMNGSTNFTFKDTVTFSCQFGYEYIKGDKQRTCQADGTWTGKTGICNEIICPEPREFRANIGFSIRKGTKHVFNSSIDISCLYFYDRIGPGKSYCQKDRTWSNTDTYCLKTCGQVVKRYPTIQQCKKGRHRAISRSLLQPWMAAIKKDGKVICSGVLINQEWILTAAHCLWNAEERYGRPGNLEVVFGAFHWDKPHQREGKIRKIKRAVFRKTFDYGIHSDVILAQLDRPVITDNMYIQPICLPHDRKKRHMFSNLRNVATFGWYRDPKKGTYLTDRCVQLLNKPTCLKHVEETHKKIQRQALGSPSGRSHAIPTDILCTNATRGKSDLCDIHPGSILVAFDKKEQKWYLGGILTWGSVDVEDCKKYLSKYDMFAKISKYIKWIKQTTRINLAYPDSETVPR